MPNPASPRIRRASWLGFDELGTSDLYAVLRLRNEVFVVEQQCAFAEIDGRDPDAMHLVVWLESASALAGCLRVFAPDEVSPHARIGRIATSASARGVGLGRWMMSEALARIDRQFAGRASEIDAQVSVERFYAGFGFQRVSDDYDEDGIVHCTMLRQPGGASCLSDRL